jgi:hypothetical protein
VPGSLPTDAAAGVAQELFASHARSGAAPSQSEFIEAVRRFERVEFDVPPVTDADGFLFQWGPASWFPEPTFTLGVTRQLEVSDSGGEHEAYIQVEMTFNYALDPELASMGSTSSWWFRHSGEDFSAWLHSIRVDPVWSVVTGKEVREFVISTDVV